MNPAGTRPTQRMWKTTRNKCRRIGQFLSVVFPEGISVKDEGKFCEMYLLVHTLDKVFETATFRFQEKPKCDRARDTLRELGACSVMWAELIQNNTKKSSKRKSLRKLKELSYHRSKNKR